MQVKKIIHTLKDCRCDSQFLLDLDEWKKGNHGNYLDFFPYKVIEGGRVGCEF